MKTPFFGDLRLPSEGFVKLLTGKKVQFSFKKSSTGVRHSSISMIPAFLQAFGTGTALKADIFLKTPLAHDSNVTSA